MEHLGGTARRGRGIAAASRAQAVVATVGMGVGGGIALGAAYRGWMRLVSTRPEFSWSGTLFIVGLVTVVVLLAAVASTARQRWRRRWARGIVRAVSAAVFVLLAAGPGAITVPTWLFAGLAIGRRTWPGWLRGVLAVLGAGGVVLVVVVSRRDLAQLGLVRSAVALVAYVALMAVIARLFAIPTGSPRPVAEPEAAATDAAAAGAVPLGA